MAVTSPIFFYTGDWGREGRKALPHVARLSAAPAVAAKMVAGVAAGARISALGTLRRRAPVGYAARLPEAIKYGTPDSMPSSCIVKAKGLKVWYMTTMAMSCIVEAKGLKVWYMTRRRVDMSR